MKVFHALALLACLLFCSGEAQAQVQRFKDRVQAVDRILFFNSPLIGGQRRAEKLLKELKERNYSPPTEPRIPKVTYLKIDPPRSLRERIDRLLQGVKFDLPPEYDHYGYEIRHYMQAIAGSEVLGNAERLKKELINIRNAEIVLEYWRKALVQEIKAIELEIEQSDASSEIRQVFRYNRGTVNAFLAETQNWIDNNRAMLKFLLSIEGRYSFKEPFFTFKNNDHKLEFISLFKAAQRSRNTMNEYMPFMVMIY